MRRNALIVALGLLLLAVPVLRVVQAQPTGQITSPRDQAAVRGLVPVEGSATHSQFQKYEVHYGPQPNPGDQWTPIGGSPFSVPVVQGRLGLWDTTLIPDGVYSLRLRIVRLDGHWIDLMPAGDLLVMHNQDLPGVMGRVGSILGSHRINIGELRLGRREDHPGAVSVWQVDEPVAEEVLDQLRALDAIRSVRQVHLGAAPRDEDHQLKK